MAETDKQHKARPSALKRMGIVLLVVLAALLSLSLIIHIPAVQNWGIRQITRYLSAKTGSAVSVRSFDLNIFSAFTMKDVYISQEAAPSDTLLYAGDLGVRFSRIWKLFSGDPEIRQVQLNRARLYIDDRPITFLSITEKKSGSKGLHIRNPEILVSDVVVRINKSRQSMTQEFMLPRGTLRIDDINTEQKTLRLALIQLEKPSVILTVKPDSLIMPGDSADIFNPQHKHRATSPWKYEIGEVGLSDGRLKFLQPYSTIAPPVYGINYQDMEIKDLNISLDSINIDSTQLTGEIKRISFGEQSGFQVEDMSAGRIELSRQGLAVGNLKIRTPNSIIADTVALDFRSEADSLPFADRMEFYARLNDARISIGDLLMAIPNMQESKFFSENNGESLNIDGTIHGSVNRLRGDNLLVKLGNMSFAGQFRSRDLTVPGKQILNLVVADAKFTTADLEKHLPGFKLPAQFNKLGRIQFTGKFDGFLDDFVAFGQVNTSLGSAKMDMNLETTNHVAAYQGSLSLQNFNLRKWTDIPDFGLVSANLKLNNGSGLTPETAVADISGSITQFQYKGYTYKDVLVDGRLNQNQFKGNMVIEDPNIHMKFQGSVHGGEGEPTYDFTATVGHVDFQQLHLSDKPFTLAGSFAARGQGKDINTIIGSAQASDMRLVRGEANYALDTVFLDIEKQPDGKRTIRATSDYVNGWVTGDFELNSLYPSLAHYLEESYPQYFSGIKYKKELSKTEGKAEFEVTLNKPEEWGGLFNMNGIRFRDLYLNGKMNFESDSVVIDVSAPEFHRGNVNAYLSTAHLESVGGHAKASTFVTAIDIKERYFFDEISASVQTSDQGFTWELYADDLLEELNTLGASGSLTIDSNNTYTLHVDPKIIEVLNQKWELKPGNQVRLGKDFIELKDVVFQHGDQLVTIDDVNRRGIMIESKRFDLGIIDEIWDYEKLDFNGPYTLRAGLSDIFQKKGFYVKIDAPVANINNDPWGALSVDCKMEQMGSPVAISLGLEQPGSHLTASGTYYPPVEEVDQKLQNTMDLNISLDTFPIRFLEYFLKDGVRNTTGYVVGGMRIFGPLKDTKMDGKAIIHNGATTVAYLGTRYFFDQQEVRLTESVIDATGDIITDTDGNTATVSGGLTHRRLGNLGLNARIRSPRVIALNTTKADNSVYYGFGVGSVDVTFRGLLERPTISVDAVTDQGTHITINLADESVARKNSFIRFRDDLPTGRGDLRTQTNITGMNFEMNLTATTQATVEIILEDNPPESIVGSGSGNIQMSITRTGDFTMYGAYEIDHGNYLFRSFVVINKPFELRRGGTIQWTGDPYNADINLQAEYVGVRTSLSTFLAEYLTNASAAANDEARQKTDVQLILLLTGTLLEPEINFDLRFPNLSGELAGYADTKLRVLRSNQNAMNEQVFGLLWAGSFLPSNVLQTDASLTLAEQGITNTMSEFFSNQVSTFFSGVISRWVGSDVDLDFGYLPGSQFDLPNAQGTSKYQEWEVRVKNRLFNDRVIIDAGANYITDSPLSPGGSGAYFVGDYALEYLLTKDGRLKIRFYHRNELTIEGRKNKLGIGLAWRREFDSFAEWLGGLEKEAKKMKKTQEDPENIDQ